MPDEKEKLEGFMSEWKKKMENESQPSLIGETLDKLKTLEKENMDLKKKIAENAELLKKSEELIKSYSIEKEKLKLEKEELKTNFQMKINDLEKKNQEYGAKIRDLVKLLIEKEETVKTQEKQIDKLMDDMAKSSLVKPAIDQNMIEDLKKELNKRDSKIRQLEEKMSKLEQENEALNQQLVEKLKSLPVDFVVPIEESEKQVIEPSPPESSPKPLELLIQDLQSDLNRHKRMIKVLTQEKDKLQKMLMEGGISQPSEEINSLKKENEKLRKDVENLKNQLKESAKSLAEGTLTREYEEKIKELQVKIDEKNKIIAELKLSQPTSVEAPKGPMANLIEELQNTINKLKKTIREKDEKIIELNKMLSSL